MCATTRNFVNVYFLVTKRFATAMGQKFVLILIIVCLHEIKVCVALAACTKYQGMHIVNGCQQNAESEALKLYFDTSTVPSYAYVRCKCEIYVTDDPTTVNLNADYRIKESSHSLEIGNVVLNSTITEGSVTVHGRTELWITSHGFGGVCFNISADKNIGVSCFTQANSSSTPVHASTARVTKKNKVLTTASSVEGQNESITESTQSLDDTGNDTRLYVIGPVAGGVSGTVLIAVVILIVVYFKRRINTQKEEKKHNQRSSDDDDDYTIENPMYEKADVDDNPVSSHNNAMTHINKSNDDTEGEYHYATNINEYSTTRMQGENDLPVYSSVNKKTRNQMLASKSDVYDRTNDHQLVTGRDEYHRLGEFSGKEKQTSDDALTDYDISSRKTRPDNLN